MIPDPHRSRTALKNVAEHFVIVPNEDLWRAVPGKRFGDLTGQSFGSWILGDRNTNDLSSKVPQDHECIEPLEGNRRTGQKID